jgi:flavodoxin
MSSLIAYSSGKNIQYISNIIKERYDSDIVEIKDLNRKKGFFSNIRSNYNALRNNLTEITPESIDLSEYNLILLGCPSTLGNISPALNTFISNCDFNNKNVMIYTTTNGSNATNVLKQIKKAADKKGANVVNSFIIRTNNKSKQELLINTVKLLPQLDIDLYI